MDLFKYNNVSFWVDGEAINGWDSVSWTERYRDPGEFQITCELSSGLKEFLPLGTLISHMGTMEVMIVENYQVTEEEDASPILKITGRSFETYLEHRIVGQNQDWATPPATLPTYELIADYTSQQIITLINDHIVPGDAINIGDTLTRVAADTLIVGGGVQEVRIIKRGDLHTRVRELLEIDDLGIKVSRSHSFDEPFQSVYTVFLIYSGEDKRNTVVFSSQSGDILGADYLWSIKRQKNAALISGRFVETMVYGVETGYNRRVMLVDGSDIDGALTEVPIGTELTDMRAAMAVRGRAALTAQTQIVLSRADVSDTQSYQFRIDYNVGDIVAIDGSFGEKMPMRVIEYVEIVDENGQSGHPTLSILKE